MSIKTYRPTTPARRQMTVSGFDGVDKHARPEKKLIEVLKKNSGRDSYGSMFFETSLSFTTAPTAAHSSHLSSTLTASVVTSWLPSDSGPATR